MGGKRQYVVKGTTFEVDDRTVQFYNVRQPCTGPAPILPQVSLLMCCIFSGAVI